MKPDVELELQEQGEFTEEEVTQLIEDLATLLISAWHKRREKSTNELAPDTPST